MAASPALLQALEQVLGPGRVATGEAIAEEELHDESLHVSSGRPLAVVHPTTTAQVQGVVQACAAAGVPIVARGGGTGLSGGCEPIDGVVLCAFSEMAAIREIDVENHVAVVEPGVTLAQLNAALAPHGLFYPVFPGESASTLGGNVNTNAGGMRAVRHGVTRHHVLGLELVLATGEVLRTGGRVTKISTGYDLTQLVVGSEGTLALVTEIIVKLTPILAERATVLVPFATLEEVAAAVPAILNAGLEPSILEYVDLITMSSITGAANLELGIPEPIQAAALAYLVVVLETRHVDQLDRDVEDLGTLLGDRGALEVYVLPPPAGEALIVARERAFYVAKRNGADDIVDVVVPRATIPSFLSFVAERGAAAGAFIIGCGHAGDGNVHLSVFLADEERRAALLLELFEEGMALGGAISGEHGIGRAKQSAFLQLFDPANLALQRRIKAAFDPAGLLGPGRLHS